MLYGVRPMWTYRQRARRAAHGKRRHESASFVDPNPAAPPTAQPDNSDQLVDNSHDRWPT